AGSERPPADRRRPGGRSRRISHGRRGGCRSGEVGRAGVPSPQRSEHEVVVVDSDRSVIEVAFSGTRGPLFASGASSAPTSGDGADGEERSLAGRLVVVTGATGLLGAS